MRKKNNFLFYIFFFCLISIFGLARSRSLLPAVFGWHGKKSLPRTEHPYLSIEVPFIEDKVLLPLLKANLPLFCSRFSLSFFSFFAAVWRRIEIWWTEIGAETQFWVEWIIDYSISSASPWHLSFNGFACAQNKMKKKNHIANNYGN